MAPASAVVLRSRMVRPGLELLRPQERMWTGVLAAGFLGAAALGSMRAFAHYRPDALFVDARTFYLPFAHEFLRSGFGFLADPRSLEVGPFSYIYPALFGAHVKLIKLFNVALFGCLVLVAGRIATVLHSRLAGLCTAWLFALSPTLPRFFPDLASETPFIALTVVWIWGLVEIMVGRRRAFIAVAGVAFGLCMVTRPTYLYFAYAVVVLAGTLALRVHGELRWAARDLFLVHAVAVAFPLAVIVKNLVLFGFAGVNTGLGATLYLGSHPLTGGVNPRFLGLTYDNTFVTQGAHRLSLEGDRLLKGVALIMLRDRPLPDLLGHFADKAATFFFVTKQALSDSWFNLRSLRIAETAAAVVGLWAIRTVSIRWLFGTALIYQVAVHTPLFYVPRYSIVVDIWLPLLAGVGLVASAERIWRGAARDRRIISALAAAAVIGIVLGQWHRIATLDRMPDVLSVPHRGIVSYEGPTLTQIGVAPSALAQRLGGPAFLIPAQGIETVNPLLGGRRLLVASFRMAVARPARCRSARLLYRADGDPRFGAGRSRAFRIRADGRVRWYHVGLFPLDVRRDGEFLLQLECPPGTDVDLTAFKLSEDLVARTYRERYLEGRAAAP